MAPSDVPVAARVTQRWLLYALGGGLGHLTRALALAKAGAGRGHRVEIVCNSPFAADLLGLAAHRWPDVTIVPLSPDLDRDAVAERIGDHVRNAAFDGLVVDTFPRGLGGELAPLLPRLGAAKVLVHRDLDPSYVADREVAAFVTHYDLLLLPGERGPLAVGPTPRRVATAPWLVCDAYELWPRDETRVLLDADRDTPLVVVLGTGSAEEAREMADVARTLGQNLGASAMVRFVAPPSARPRPRGRSAVDVGDGTWRWHWPMLELLAGVDVLVGAAGYNTVAEAQATTTPLVCFVRERRYDRQWRRALGKPGLVVTDGDPRQLVPAVRQALREARATPIAYCNGAHDAALAIEQLCSGLE